MGGRRIVRTSAYARVLLDELLDQAKQGELDDLAAEVYDGLAWHEDYAPTDDELEKRECLVGAIRELYRLASSDQATAEGEGA